MYLTILDFNSGRVSIYKIQEDIDVEYFIECEGFQISNCQYMTGSELTIKI